MKKFNLKKLVAAATLTASVCTSGFVFAKEQVSSVWKVTKGNDSLYVGGTIHILPISEFPLPEQFDRAYKDSDSIVLEAKLPAPSDMEAQQAMLQAMTYADGQNLKEIISEQTYNDLSKYLQGFGADLDQVAHFKPSFIVSMMVAMEAQRSSMAGSGVDAYFAQVAARDGKPQEYLETLEFQLDMLSNLGLGDEDQLIRSNLAYMPQLKEMLTSLIAAWRAGDVKQLEYFVVEKMKKESPASFKTVMTDRNQDWVPKIEKMFGDEDKEFVLVGAGHLVGEKNVLTLLQQKGYKVERL